MISFADIIVVILLAALLYVCIRSVLPDRKTGRSCCSCGGNCSSCALNCMAQAVIKRKCNS